MNKTKYRILITGGAGFIGSNLVDHFLDLGHFVVCLDDLSTGFEKNISHHFENPDFVFIKGDIRNMETCRKAIKDCNYVLHQAALGSVPRSINDPANTNSVNITGFLNILIAARDEGIKRFVYAASSSTYGDSEKLPKVEEEIGKPLSPYAVTKYVNELYADVFAKTYGMECIGLRYFNVFGKRQSPEGAYAAVIPLWVKQLMNLERPVINGDGSYSRDFTYIDNVIQANEKAILTPSDKIRKRLNNYCKKNTPIINGQHSTIAFITDVFNIAFGQNTTLFQLFEALRTNLARYDKKIINIEPTFQDFRKGDIPHSLANVRKANLILEYNPIFCASKGIEMTCEWYFNNLVK